jgi:hypothetical protein
MSFKLLFITVKILGLMGCSKSETGNNFNQLRRGSEALVGAQGAGVDTARQTVQKAKDFIINLLANSEDSVFEQFPEEMNKDILVQIVQGLSFSGNERFRSNQPLLMDHDLQNKKIFYTSQFVAKFGTPIESNLREEISQNSATSNLATTNLVTDLPAEAATEPTSVPATDPIINPITDPSEELRVIKEIAELVLQELAHLLNLGRTEQTKNIAQQFSSNLLNHLLTETVICEGQQNNSPFAMAINPPTGMSFYIPGKTRADLKPPSNYNVARPNDSNLNAWRLGQAFPFFDLNADEATGAVQVAVDGLTPELGVPMHSSYDLLEVFQGLLENTDRIIFWNLQNGIATQSYRSNYRTEMDSIRMNIQESGVINLNLQNLSEARLNSEVQKNNILDDDLSLQIPMSCETVTSSFDLQNLVDLNTAGLATQPALANSTASPEVQTNPPANPMTERESINDILESRGCGGSDLSEAKKNQCEALENLLLQID